MDPGRRRGEPGAYGDRALVRASGPAASPENPPGTDPMKLRTTGLALGAGVLATVSIAGVTSAQAAAPFASNACAGYAATIVSAKAGAKVTGTSHRDVILV